MKKIEARELKDFMLVTQLVSGPGLTPKAGLLNMTVILCHKHFEGQIIGPLLISKMHRSVFYRATGHSCFH